MGLSLAVFLDFCLTGCLAVCLGLARLYVPLHHKYRPQTFAQLVGQSAIATTLTQALQQNRIAPAYLFCGPRGTGKTSSARILAKSLNCLQADAPTSAPCGQCDVCQSVSRGNALDIVEIDAASNTGVDNIRELIERSQFAPVQCRYKVYVIDECHMLSTAAFNALLKTLEEPPDRVVFVLATTDPQRVLPTIISRCQRFDFRRIPLPSLTKHLSYIASQETIQIVDSALQLVAQISQGGLRDAESLLDQLSLQADEITLDAVWDLVGAVPERDLLNVVRAIAADDSTALLERVRQLMDKGREPLIVLQGLVGFYRDLLIAKSAPARDDLVAITAPTWAEMIKFAPTLSTAQLLAGQQKLQSAEVQVKNTTQPRLWLEITLTGLLPSALSATANLPDRSVSRPALPSDTPLPASRVAAPLSEPIPADAPAASPAISPLETGISTKPVAEPAALKPPAEPVSEPVAEVAFSNLADLWRQILAALQPRPTQMVMSQQGVLLGFDGVGAKVGFRAAALQKMAQDRVPNLEAAFAAVFHRKIKVSLEIVTTETAPPPSGKYSQDPLPSAPAQTDSPAIAPPNGVSNSVSNGVAPASSLTEEPAADLSPPQPPEPPADSNPSARLDPPTAHQGLDQDQEKIKRFANFFNGQIVNLDDDLDEPTAGNSSRLKSSEPGPDVPF